MFSCLQDLAGSFNIMFIRNQKENTMIFLSAVICLLMTATYVHAGEWQLVWSDEFNYTGLPDNTKWSYKEGLERNGEEQYYTRARKENARVESGVLIIEARNELFKNPRYKPNSLNFKEDREYAQYTSAALITLSKASWKYGRIEVRAKLPQGSGVWPAIWTLGENMPSVGWPKCGEIDIMEYFGNRPNQITSNAHYSINGKTKSQHGDFELSSYDDFHIFAIEWGQDRIDFFFDGTKYNSLSLNSAGDEMYNPFRQNHYLLLNLAIGGNSGRINGSNLPQKFVIDYVRVYQK
jgi:beta-glucanase (GH16 family)